MPTEKLQISRGSQAPYISIRNRFVTWLMVAVIWLAVVLGCKLPPVPPQPRPMKDGCVTPDNSLVGLTGADTYLVDAKTGAIKRRIEKQIFFNNVLCLPNNEIVALTTTKAVWLTSEKEVAGDFEKSLPALAPLDNDTFVGAYQSIFKEDQSDERADQMWVTFGSLNPDQKAKDNFKLRDLPNEVIGTRMRETPIRLLPDGRLLIAAGSSSHAVLGKFCNWGFFTLDLGAQKVGNFGSVKKDDLTVCLHERSTNFAATPDGKMIAGVFGQPPDEKRTLVLFDSGNELLRVPIDGVQGAYVVSLNQDGSRVAVGLQLKQGNSFAVDVFDARTGKQLWQRYISDSLVYLQFLNDDSLVMMTEKGRLYKRDGKTGTELWDVELQSQKDEKPASTANN